MDIFLFTKRERAHIFSHQELILHLKSCHVWHDTLTPLRHTGSNAYFPNQIAILDPKQNNQKNGVLTAEHLMTVSLEPFCYLTLLNI